MRNPTSLVVCALAQVISGGPPAYGSLQSYQPADFVLGQLSPSGTVFLKKPSGVAVDPATGKVFVADTEHSRVLRYGSSQTLANGAAPEAVFGQANFWTTTSGLAADKLGRPISLAFTTGSHLWVVDFYSHRVLRFDNASSRPSGGSADGVLGQSDFVSSGSGLSASKFFFAEHVAGSGASLFVADQHFRVLRFNNAAQKANGAGADAVFGQPDFVTGTSGLSAQKFSGITGIVAEPVGPFGSARLWVADYFNNRVLGFDGADSVVGAAGPATRVLGQSDFVSDAHGTTASAMNHPVGLATLAISSGSSLYVGDSFNHRVLRFDNPGSKGNGAAAQGLLGQSDFTSSETTGPVYSFSQLAGDPSGALWMAGLYNNLILRFSQTNPRGLGGTYDLLLGGGGTKPAEVPISGDGLALDPVSGKVFVSESETNQILRFGSYAALEARSTPEAIFGTGAGNSYANSMVSPHGLAIDAGGRLWAADWGNHRVLRFDNAATRSSNPNADGVLGQLDFGLATAGTSASKLTHPVGVAADGPVLWVMDADNNRVLRFDNAATKANGAAADGVLGQVSLSTSVLATSSSAMSRPCAAAADGHGRLWVLDGGNNRVLRFDAAASKSNGAVANGVLGQPNFTTKTPGSAADKLNTFRGSLVVDRTGRLYVGEESNNRVVWFNRAALKASGANADGLLGQPTFGLSTAGSDERHLGSVYGLCLDPEAALWAVDNANQRLLRFRSTIPSIESVGLNASQQPYLQFTTVAGDDYGVLSSSDLKTWADDSPAVTGVGNLLLWTDTYPMDTRRFYRVIELPQ